MSAVLLLNMLIAMLTTTFERIQHQSDVEWKFARALMFRGYMGGQSYPAPFNLLCHMSIIIFSRMFRLEVLYLWNFKLKHLVVHTYYTVENCDIMPRRIV